MRGPTVAFHLADAQLASCTLVSIGGRTIGRVTRDRPLRLRLPPGTHVLRAIAGRTCFELDVQVEDVGVQEIGLAEVGGELVAIALERGHPRSSRSQRTS